MERITENLKILNQPACYATGVRRFERARVQELADQGRSVEEISHIMRVQLSAIEALITAPVAAPAATSPVAAAATGAPKRRRAVKHDA